MLNPTEPVWPALVKAAIFLSLVVVSGIPIARTIFSSRHGLLWIGYTPVLGIGLNLLTANMLALISPGVVGSWMGIITALGLSSLIAIKTGFGPTTPSWSRSTYIGLGLSVLLVAAILYLALANRTHLLFTDEPWHLPLAATIARGLFPPVSPFSPDFGAAYHYGSDLLAASMMNISGTAPWTAFFLLSPFLAVIVAITATTVGLDFGAPRLVALGAGLVTTFAGPQAPFLTAGLPTAFTEHSKMSGFGDVLLQFGPPPNQALFLGVGPAHLNLPHFALGIAFILLMAAIANAEPTGQRAGVFGLTLGLLPLAETAVFAIGAVGTLAYLGITIWTRHRHQQLTWSIAVVGGLLLATLGGGAITDALFRNPGGTGTSLRILPEIQPLSFGHISESGFNLLIGPLGLVLGVGMAACWFRSRGLGFLATVSVGGLVLRQVLSFEVSGIDTRLLDIPYALAALGTLIGLGLVIAKIKPVGLRIALGVALTAMIAVPTTAPRLIGSGNNAIQGIDLGYPTIHSDQIRYANPTRFAAALRDQWPALIWMRDSLPTEARVLSTNPPLVSLATGLAAPMSGNNLGLFNPLNTPVYMDAITFLAQDDLDTLKPSHLYTTPDLIERLDQTALAALNDPYQFRLLTEQRSLSGQALRVYEIQPSAGVTTTHPASFRQLAALANQTAAVTVAGFLSQPQRQSLLLNLGPNQRVFGPPTYLPRTSARFAYTPIDHIRPGLVVLHDAHVPIAFGLDREDAIWRGSGMRAYIVNTDVWSPTWRPGPESQPLPPTIISNCDPATTNVAIRFIGEPGDILTVATQPSRLTGLAQVTHIANNRCADIRFAWSGTEISPFVQIRSNSSIYTIKDPATAGLAFDGGLTEQTVVIHIWYRNPASLPSEAGTELRLYPANVAGILASAGPADSAVWWLGPIDLSAERFTDRLEFDAATLELTGVQPGVQSKQISDGHYVLALTVTELDVSTGKQEFLRVIPLLQVRLKDDTVSYHPLSGIVAIGN